MGEWKEYLLDEVIEKFIDYRGKTPTKTDSGVPLITAKVVKNGTIAEPNEFISKEDYHKWMRRGYPEIDDIVLTTEAPLGEVALLKSRDVALAQRIITLRAYPEKAHNPFIKYYLQSPTGQYELESRASGTTVLGIKSSVLKKLPVTMPAKDEQVAIASVLSSLDAKIDLLHRQNKTLEAMAEALFRQWFVEEAEEPWPWEQLSSHVEVLRGLSYNGAGLCEKGEGVPMHNLNSIYEGGGYKYDGVKYYKGEYKDRHIVLPGDVLVANTEQGHDQLLIGCPAIVPAYFGDAGIFSQHVYKLKLLTPTFSNVFVKQLLLSADVREQLTGSTNGSTVNMLPKDGIEMAKFRMPPKEKIERFNAIAAPLHQKQEKNYIQIQTLIAQRDTLLPKLMSGEVRVEILETHHA